jgi:hypothetical protein
MNQHLRGRPRATIPERVGARITSMHSAGASLKAMARVAGVDAKVVRRYLVEHRLIYTPSCTDPLLRRLLQAHPERAAFRPAVSSMY